MKNLLELIKAVDDHWYSVPLSKVNGHTVFLRVMNNHEAAFHSHNDSDELFFVLSGCLYLDIETRTKKLEQGEAYTVKAGVRHRARVVGRAEMIVVSEIVA